MLFSYDVPAYRPVLGEKYNGQQVITVYDRKTNSMINITTSAEKADKFVKERQETLNDAAKRGWIHAIGATALATIFGAMYKGKKTALRYGFPVACFGVGLPFITTGIADKRITNEFIENNK